MTNLGAGLILQLVLAAVAMLTALTIAPSLRATVTGSLSALLALAGLTTGALAMTGATGGILIPLALPMDALILAPDRLGGLFMVVVSVVGLLVSIYGIGSATGPATSRTAWAALPIFLLGMQLVPAATDSVSFLLAWEIMTLGSTVLLLADHASRASVASAGIWYSAMSQLSFFLVLAGFAVLAAATGGTSFAAMATIEPGSWAANLAFLLLLLGFGGKAELVPLHVWVPRVLPEAPSHVSAAMSGAMVKIGVYGALLVCLRLLPEAPPWWGILIMLLGGASALYGILQASVSSDLKVLLAYSTTENMGLVFLSLGASVLLRSYDAVAAADAALIAALLLAVSHAVFKATLFLGAGAIIHATGERNLDRLGGLGSRMPWTALSFGIASLGAAAIPVTSGFVAEWMLLQSLIHGGRLNGEVVSVAASVAMPLAVAVVALTAGLALLTFVKAYGIAFLARPRSSAAALAHDVPLLMRFPLLLGALGVLALGLIPGPVAAVVAATVGPQTALAAVPVGLGGVALPGIGAVLDPVMLVVLSALVLIPILIAIIVSARTHPERINALPWGGGGSRARPRMQYTATSYAEPLVRVFDDVLKPSRDVQVTHVGESRYLVERVKIEQTVSDVIETRLYRPVLNLMQRYGIVARYAANGSIHRYLTYSFVAFLIVLIVVSL
ncbi:proton-conducting transporter membrane subunit [Cryobacterium psychrophilum]|uniref:Hydrogenase 4 subunit B n=1 Tax=Cryobacterium psychrophilum TaxID=41988 RepID=A0A4Y8KQU5_9MICO|nr:proton-conducting transporter membrane subunit [Cryobacterium psychrophilum]TDW29057.1 formate hydrogenlyase subunit 3/multisubunit Na+/H+ antiporter MnhD subunit [Cryobacterium psychrophilum]TFD79730.1 hydrogenase 4 subunit B [Cryobacterium psychrophilum]